MQKKQTHPKYLDGTSDANASSRVDAMFRVHAVSSQSNGSQAGSASTKRVIKHAKWRQKHGEIADAFHMWSK
jgi:hypothetical protein